MKLFYKTNISLICQAFFYGKLTDRSNLISYSKFLVLFVDDTCIE